MTGCAVLFQGVAIWAGLPATLFALMLLAYRLNTRFTWSLLLLGMAGLAAEGLAVACTGWATGTAQVPTPGGLAPVSRTLSPNAIWRINVAWLAGSMLVMLACLGAVWRLLRRR